MSTTNSLLYFPNGVIKTDSPLQLVAIKLHAGDAQVEEVLGWMANHGQSVSLNFGEDDNLWECSWISGGIRFTGNQRGIRSAILESLNKCFAHCVRETEGDGKPR